MTQSRLKDSKRPQIGVSIDPEVLEWINSLPGPSVSYKVSRILLAAMKAEMTIDDAKSPGILHEFSDFLKTKKKNKHAADLNELLSEFLDN